MIKKALVIYSCLLKSSWCTTSVCSRRWGLSELKGSYARAIRGPIERSQGAVYETGPFFGILIILVSLKMILIGPRLDARLFELGPHQHC